MPATEPLFQQDAYLRSCSATVIEVCDEGVVLDRTVFYPLGGGQPGDSGTLRLRDLPPRSQVMIDSRPLTTSGAAIRLPVGWHEVAITAPGTTT